MKFFILKRLLPALIILAAGYWAWGAFFGSSQKTGGPRNQLPIVEVGQVQAQTLADSIEAVGTSRAFESISITAKTSGTVADISFNEGDDVEAQKVLITLDKRERQADRDQAFAQIAEAKAKREDAQIKLDRAISLTKSGAVTEAKVDELKSALIGAEGNVASLEARLRATDARLQDMVIVAPFSGRVGLRNISIGALVDSGARITTLDDISKIRVDFSVPEREIKRLKEGLSVQAQTSSFPNKVFTGDVDAIDSRVDNSTRMVKLSAILPNPDKLLKPGMFMQVNLKVEERQQALMVPEEALVGEAQKTFIFKLNDKKVEKVQVETGLRKDGLIEIVKGLSLNDQIIVRGIQRLRNGVEVSVKK